MTGSSWSTTGEALAGKTRFSDQGDATGTPLEALAEEMATPDLSVGTRQAPTQKTKSSDLGDMPDAASAPLVERLAIGCTTVTLPALGRKTEPHDPVDQWDVALLPIAEMLALDPTPRTRVTIKPPAGKIEAAPF